MQLCRLENETDKAFLAFCIFCAMQPISVHDVAKLIGARVYDINRWSSVFEWNLRFQKYSKDFGKSLSLPQKNPEIMHLRHLKDALDVQAKALEKLQSIDPQKLSNSEAIRFLTAGTNLERLSMRELLGQKTDEPLSHKDLEAVESFLEEE